MKKTISKSMAWILSVVMVFGMLVSMPVENAKAYTSHSRDEAIAWAKSKIGSKIDMDGYPTSNPYQCVDLIKAYYQYLGASGVSGNGCDYSHNSLPSGWTRIQNTASFVPNPGDIVVWTDEGWKNGHVAIFLSGNTSSFTSIDQNWPQGSEVKEVSHSYKYVWGVIRPDFSGGSNYSGNTFHGLSKVDKGSNFYSMIIRNENWAHISDENGNAAVNDNGNIVWYFSKTSDGGYTIKNVATGKYLDVYGAGDSDNNNVQTWEYNGGAAQIWYIYGSYDGEYVFKPKCTADRVLNVYAPTGEAFIYTFDSEDKDMRFHLWTDISTYTVSYNMNGGNGSIGNQTKVQYSPLTLSSTRPTRSGYTFVGWNTNKNATTAQYQPGGRYTDNNGATLYAIWKANTYTIAYNANGGSGSMNSSSIYYGQTLTLPECKFTKTGYNCVGYNVRRNSDNKWYTNEKGWITEQEINNTKSNKKVYSIKGSYGFDSSWTGGASSNDTFTFYPVWKVKTVTVTFYRNQNGSDNTTATQTFTYGASGQSFSNKNWTKNGYTLLGWSFDRNATTASYSVLSGVTDNWIKDNSPSRNLYAVWKRTDENLGTYKYANPNKTTLYARISYNGTNKYLTNLSDNASNDKSYKNIQLKTKNDSLQQVWEFEKLSDGGYKISSVYDGRILDIYNTKTDNGTNIGACGTYYANGGQIWYLIKKDGKYLIQPKVSPDIYLGVANTNDGGNIQVTTSSHLFNIEILKPVGTSTMQVTQEGTSASPTKFTWTAASDATWYNLYIYDGEVWKSNCIYGQKNIKGLEWSVQLKPGKYQAHLSPINIHNWTNSNFVSFTVKENKYTMNYNANGGTGTMNTQTLIFGENFTVPENKFVKTGYDFTCFNMYRSYDNKWYVGDGNGWQTQNDIDKNGYKKKEYRPGDKHPMDIYWTSNYSGDLSFTFYPVWKAKQVTVTFYRNQNSSDNTTATQTFTYGASGQSFSNKNWTKDGYTLLGWSENRNATEKQYSITNGVGSDWINQKSPKVNLYAVWKINAPSEKPIISGLNEIYDVGEDIIITWNKVDRATSYHVSIWRNPGTEATKIIDTDVTANSYTLNNVIPGKHSIWIDAVNTGGKTTSDKYSFYVPYTIKYDVNGGTGSISSTSKIPFTDCNLSSTKPTRTGYDFVGWNTNQSATTAQYQPGDKYTANSGTTLYAIWQKVDYKAEPNVKKEFNGKTYEYYSQKLSWVQAYKFCEKKGGHLVTINSKEENIFLIEMTKDFNDNIWTGGRREDHKSWYWITGEAFDYQNWSEGEPNNDGGNQTVIKLYKTGKWDDEISSNKYSFICEYDTKIDSSKYNPVYKENYNGHEYWFFEDKVNWSTAKRICEVKGGHLVIIEDEAENNMVLSGFKKTANEEMWIGCTDIAEESVWKDVKGNTIEYTNWENNQPDNYLDIEDYVEMFSNGKWNDERSYRSMYRSVGFVCEFDDLCTANGHSYVNTVVAPTTTEQGYTLHTCSICGHSYKDAYTNKLLDNTSTLSSNAIKLGTPLTVNASATGGTGDYEYAVFYKKADSTKWTTAQNFGTNSTVKIKPAKAVKYDVLVKAKDSSGKSAEKTFTVDVYETLKNTSTVVAENIGFGDTITVKAKSTGGLGDCTYAVYYKKSSAEKWSTLQKYSDNTIVTFKPASATTYDVMVKVKDSRDVIVKKTFTVSVTKPENTSTIAATSIKLDKTLTTLGKGETITLKATTEPSNTTNKTVTWTSSNAKVATVDTNGKVAAKETGTVTVTAKTSNGKTATCKITVKAAPSSVTLSKTSLSLGVGETFSLSSSIPANTAAAVRTFSSSDSYVVKMTKTNWTGEFKAMKVGTAKVTVKLYNGKTAACTVTVKAAPASVSLPKTSTSLGVGETYSMGAILPANTAAATRTFSSSNSSVVKMTKTNWTGEFKAMKVGTAKVTVKLYNGKTATCTVTVRNVPASVSLSKTSVSMGVGETFTLSAILPANTAAAVRTYSSSNSSIVQMTRTDWVGTFKAMKVGTAKVTVKLYNGKTATCTVTVKEAPISVKLNKGNMTLKVGQKGTVSAVIPTNAAAASRTYRSSDPSVVQMTKTNWTGEFVAKKVGTAYVTVRLYNGKEASIKVTVVK